jgi:hypothetical protein
LPELAWDRKLEWSSSAPAVQMKGRADEVFSVGHQRCYYNFFTFSLGMPTAASRFFPKTIQEGMRLPTAGFSPLFGCTIFYFLSKTFQNTLSVQS